MMNRPSTSVGVAVLELLGRPGAHTHLTRTFRGTMEPTMHKAWEGGRMGSWLRGSGETRKLYLSGSFDTMDRFSLADRLSPIAPDDGEP